MHLSTPVLNRSYIYNANGDLQKISDLMGANTQSFGYDQNDRLIKANGPWGTGTIGYDNNGNITNLTAGAASSQYTYDASNKLTSTTGAYAFSYGYNPYGDVISDGKTTYDYNLNIS
jgi:YD repeat-containing protein